MGYNNCFGVPRNGIVPRDSDSDNYLYKVSVSAGFGAAVFQFQYSYRSGDRFYCKGIVLCGTTAASVAFIQLPPGLTINLSRFNYPSYAGNSQDVGQAWEISSTARTGPYYLFLDNTNANTSQIFFGNNTLSSFNFAKLNGSAVCNDTEYMSFEFSVPVKEWAI